MLTRAQFQHEIKPMLPSKFGNVAVLAKNAELGRLFDRQAASAEKHYASSNVVISGTPPSWPTIAAALPAWRALLD